MIYDLDNRYGGRILAQTGDIVGNAGLEVNSSLAGKPALSILSTASGSPLVVANPQFGNVSIQAKGATFRSTATGATALTVESSVAQNPEVAMLRFGPASAASAVVVQFGSFVSCTSLVLTSVANFDYVIRVAVGDGTFRSIPLIKDAGVIGSAAF